MSERPTLGVGIMSGTSLDGIDAALVRFEGPTHVTLLQFCERPYTKGQRHRLERAIHDSTARELAHLHTSLALWAGDVVHELLTQAHVKASEIEFIAFPGQTIWHEPPVVTWQLGEPALLAERFGVRVVSNFRARDVAAGGQGAPLVPMADLLLFGTDHPRVLLNVGGMANLTMVRRRAVEDGIIAFDTGPGVALIDAVARLTDSSLPYDRDGALARAGVPDAAVVDQLLGDPFFAEAPPKSTGRERFGQATAERLFEQTGRNAVATAVELTARSIADALARWVPAGIEVVASGGGCRHPVLWARLTELLSGGGRALLRFDDVYFSGDAKEAVAFALLGYLTIHGQPGNLPAATGAAGARVLGTITPA